MTAICQVAVTSHYGETHLLKKLIGLLTSTACTTNSKPHINLYENNTFFFSPGDATAAEYYNQNDDQDQEQGKGHCHQYNGPGRQRGAFLTNTVYTARGERSLATSVPCRLSDLSGI